jgi:hypothetical protein
VSLPNAGSGAAVLLEHALALLTELECEVATGGPTAAGPDRAGLHGQGAALLAEGTALLAEGTRIHPYDRVAAGWARRLLVWAAALHAARGHPFEA